MGKVTSAGQVREPGEGLFPKKPVQQTWPEEAKPKADGAVGARAVREEVMWHA